MLDVCVGGGGVGCDEHYSSEGETQWQCPYGEQL